MEKLNLWKKGLITKVSKITAVLLTKLIFNKYIRIHSSNVFHRYTFKISNIMWLKQNLSMYKAIIYETHST